MTKVPASRSYAPGSIVKVASSIQVSSQLLADAPVNLFGQLQNMIAVNGRQGPACFSGTRYHRRCRRRWKFIEQQRGYCWQHRPSLVPVGRTR